MRVGRAAGVGAGGKTKQSARGLITKTKNTIVDIAKSGLEKTKPVAGAALGAAAAAATDVCLAGAANNVRY